MMADSSVSYENSFSEWLAKQVSPAQLSAIYSVFTDIDSFCLNRKILKKPLFETDDLVTLASVREAVERSKIFAFSHRKQKGIMIAAIQHYCRFIKEVKDNSNLIEPRRVSNNQFLSSEQEIPARNSLLDFLIANNISFIDNRPQNGCLWMIGGEELKPFADKCSARGVTFHFKADGSRATEYSSAWWTTDDFNSSAKNEPIVSVADCVSEDKSSSEVSFEKNNRLKFIEWLDKRGVSSGGIFVVLSSLKRCTERVKAEKILDDDIYHVISVETMNIVRSFLLADKDFIHADHRKGNQLTSALNLYSEFLNEQLTTTIAEVIVNPELGTELSVEAPTPIVSEIEALLSEEIFSPLKLVLAKENIRTIEELKALKLWAFMNQNNLYSISMRQAVLTKVRQLLEPETTESPGLLYELHCGSTVYSGDTLAKTFLRFCEDTAQKYPLFFRSLLDKTIGGTSDIRIYRFPKSGNFIRMENPTCYVSADLAKDSVIAAVEWIMQRCMSVTMSVSIKEPDTFLAQSFHVEILKKELHNAVLDEQHEIENSVSASTPDESDPSDLAANDTNEQRLNLSEHCSLAYTKPTGFSYKGKAISCTSWNELYVSLVCELYSDYESLFQRDMRFAGSSRIDLGSKERMTYPKEIRSKIYLECNISATGIVNKIRWLLDYCSVSTDDVIITYCQRDNIISRQTSRVEHSNIQTSSVRSVSSQESESVDPEQIAKVEKIVLDADMNGVTYDSLYNVLRLTMVATKALVQKCKRIVEIKGKLYHEDAFIDWDDGAKQMCLITEKLMQKNNGYISAVQLYDYARVEMNMFLNDNDLNDERSVYEIAQHLFEKNSFEGTHYSFIGKAHISKSEDVIGSNFDVIYKFAEDQGGIFREDDLTEHLTGIGIKAGNLRNQMRLGKEPEFFFYEPGTIISAKSMRIDGLWKESVGRALRNLLSDADDHIVLRQIQPVWYESLPDLPEHRVWTPLLLQYILHFYGKEFGAKTIAAMKSQSMDTLHAMLVTDDSPIQNFGDAVIACLVENETEQRSFEAEELRQLLVKTGMIQGNELIWNMPKALAKDERFAWDAKGENVTVRVE